VPFLAIPLRKTTPLFQHALVVEPTLNMFFRLNVTGFSSYALVEGLRKATWKKKDLTVAMLAAGLDRDDYLRGLLDAGANRADDEPK